MYEDVLLRLSRDGRFRLSEKPVDPLSEARNPACGDELSLTRSGGAAWGDLRFHAHACAVCLASCAALCECLAGVDRPTAAARVEQALTFFDAPADVGWKADWGGGVMPALGAVRARPMRMDCVRLPWQALRRVLTEPA